MRKLQERNIVEDWNIDRRETGKEVNRRQGHTLTISSFLHALSQSARLIPLLMSAVSPHPTLARSSVCLVVPLHSCSPALLPAFRASAQADDHLQSPFLPIQTRTKHRVTSIPTTTTVCYCPLLPTTADATATACNSLQLHEHCTFPRTLVYFKFRRTQTRNPIRYLLWATCNFHFCRLSCLHSFLGSKEEQKISSPLTGHCHHQTTG